MREALLRSTVFSFSAQTRFQWECMGHFLKHLEGSAQHETLLLVSPGSLHKVQLNHIHSTQTCRSLSASGLP